MPDRSGFVLDLIGFRYVDGLRAISYLLLESADEHACAQEMLRHFSTRHEAFPSGDVASAAAFSATLVLLGGGPGMWAFTVLSALGRIYFHAHHLLDVMVGCLVGAITVFAADKVLPIVHWTAVHAASSVLVFVIAMRAMKKQKGVDSSSGPESRRSKGPRGT